MPVTGVGVLRSVAVWGLVVNETKPASHALRAARPIQVSDMMECLTAAASLSLPWSASRAAD